MATSDASAAEREALSAPPAPPLPAGYVDGRPPANRRRLFAILGGADVEEGAAPPSSRARDAIYRRSLGVADLVAATAAFVIAITVLGHDALGVWTGVAIAMILVVCKLTGLYDRDEHLLHKTTLDEAPALFRVAGLYTLLAFLAGSKVVDGDLGRDQAVVLWALLFVLMVLSRALARRVAASMVRPERCVILGNTDAARWLESKLARCAGAKVDVVGRIPLVVDDREDGAVPVLGPVESLERLLDHHRVERALIAPGRNDGSHVLLNAIRKAKRHGVRVSVLPRLLEVVGAAYEPDDIEGATLLGVRRHGLSRSSGLLKRAFDLALALPVLILVAPLMAVVALLVKLDSPGPVFFRQRAGRARRRRLRDGQVPHHGRGRRPAPPASCAIATRPAAACSRSRATRGSPASAASCAAPRWTSSRS